MNRRFLFILIIVCYSLTFLETSNISAQRVRNIAYVSDYVEGFKRAGEEIRKLTGHVVFQDSSTTMYCDSAYFYPNQDIEAYGNLRIYPDQGKTKLTGKILHYRKADRIADINQDVVLIDEKTTLKTQSIFYDLKNGIAYYPGKGTITSEDNTIVSDRGSYDNHLKIFYFKENVVVTNPSYVIHTDTMNYHTVTKIVEFVGPTIINSKEDSIYCEKGWYNTTNDISSFRQNAWLKGDGKVIKGDTLYYEKQTGFGKGFGNVELWDTTQNIIIRGNYATINRHAQIAVVTKKALLIQVDKNDSLYMHADTIRTGTFTVQRSLVPDSLGTDSLRADSLITNTFVTDTFKFVKAYYHVKFYRKDLQGKCDSMYYSFKDSTLQFIREPVLWTGETQLSAGHVRIFIVNQKMDRMEMTGTSLIVQENDTAHYNQIKGRNMTGYFSNNEIYKMVVKGNGQSIYFPIDQGEISATNMNESTDIVLFFKNRQLDRISYINSITGAMHPPAELSGNDLFLKDFKWFNEFRPKKWEDIFTWVKKTGP